MHNKTPSIFDVESLKERAYFIGQSYLMSALGPVETATRIPFIGGSSSTFNLCDPAEAKVEAGIVADAGRPLSAKERVRAIHRYKIRSHINVARLEKERGANTARRDRLRGLLNRADELTTWSRGLYLERADASRFADLRRDAAVGRVDLHDQSGIDSIFPACDYEKEVFTQAEVFVVQHDWLAAFGSSLPDDQFRLPHEVCAFEFQASGRRVIILAAEVDGHVVVTPAVETSSGWVMHGCVYSDSLSMSSWYNDSSKHSVAEWFMKHIKAICIALDAEVAQANVQRVPHTGPGKNVHGTPPSYRVVSLARRYRTLPASLLGVSGRRVRLHFRRGHWRHFESHKTWIKWMLVGDPDLGFVDKEYRL